MAAEPINLEELIADKMNEQYRYGGNLFLNSMIFNWLKMKLIMEFPKEGQCVVDQISASKKCHSVYSEFFSLFCIVWAVWGWGGEGRFSSIPKKGIREDSSRMHQLRNNNKTSTDEVVITLFPAQSIIQLGAEIY